MTLSYKETLSGILELRESTQGRTDLKELQTLWRCGSDHQVLEKLIDLATWCWSGIDLGNSPPLEYRQGASNEHDGCALEPPMSV